MLDQGDQVAALPHADWKVIDRELRTIARRRAQLDAEEARWLREAERARIWRELGMVSAIDYMERVLGHTPHVATERLRVARALGDLPATSDAFELGELSFSAVRELTRVATPETEARWLNRALAKSVREVEQLVAGHKRGDDPSDTPDPEIRMHDVRFRLPPETYARLRQVRATLGDAAGGHVDDIALIELMCDAVLDRATDSGTEPNGRAKFQIALSLCPRCDGASQEGAGRSIPVDAAAVERARCDAQHIGSLDGDAPERASQDIPPSIVRFVWRRDGGCCQTPGCRSTIGLEIHHLLPRAHGGTHDPMNLCLACSACHAAIHRGTLQLSLAPDGRFEAHRPNEPKHVAEVATDGGDDTVIRDACSALVGLGWKPAIARQAVNDAASHVGRETTIEILIRESLRRCPKPGG